MQKKKTTLCHIRYYFRPIIYRYINFIITIVVIIITIIVKKRERENLSEAKKHTERKKTKAKNPINFFPL